MEEVLKVLGVILGVSFLTETLVEFFFGKIVDNVPALEKLRWLIVYVAALVGVGGAFIYQFDLIALMSKWFEMSPVIGVHPFGIAITGLSIGRGANYIHQFMTTYFPSKK